MGANRRQGWGLLAFVVGFTFLPAGLVYLGPLFTLVGLACLVGSAIALRQIKPLEHGVPEQNDPSRKANVGDAARAQAAAKQAG